MNVRKTLLLTLSHLVLLGVGFAAGIYTLPILTAPPAPDRASVERVASSGQFAGTFSRDRKDSDALHYGEGDFTIGANMVSFMGSLAPGPDYRLYLSPVFIETEEDFNRHKNRMIEVGDVKTFDNFLVAISEPIDPTQFNTAIVWCESFGQFITSGSYEPIDQ